MTNKEMLHNVSMARDILCQIVGMDKEGARKIEELLYPVEQALQGKEREEG